MPINPFPEQDPDQLFYQEWDALDPKKPAPIEELPEEESEDESAFFEEFGKGVSAGVIQEDALIFGAARAGYGSLAGNEETFNAGMNYYQERMEAAAEYAPRASWDEDWDSFSDYTNFFAYTLGNAIPSIATGIAFGGAGGVATKAAAKKFASDRIERIAKERMEAAATATADQIARDAVQGAFRKQVANKYAKIGGATTAGVGTGATLHFGENFSRIYEETGLQDPGVALTTAMFSGALDSVGIPFRALRQLFPDDTRMLSNLKEHIAENVLTTNGRKRFGNMSREAGLVAGSEGLIEAGQEFMTRSAVMWAKENLPEEQQAQFIGYMSDDEAFSNYRHAFWAGTIGGVSIGAGIGAAQPVTREDGVTTLNNEIEKKRLETINEAKRVAAEEAEKPLDQTPIDLPPVDGPVQAIDVETGQIVDVPEALVQESDAAPVQEVIPESAAMPEEEINLNDFDFTDTVDTIAVIPGGARLEDIAESRGVENTDQQEILDILEERGLVTQSIDSGVVTYSVRDDLDAEPEISVPAEETPAPTEPVQLPEVSSPVESVNAEDEDSIDFTFSETGNIYTVKRDPESDEYYETPLRGLTLNTYPLERMRERVQKREQIASLPQAEQERYQQEALTRANAELDEMGAEPLADTQGRVEPTVSAAPEETIPTEPVVEDTGFGGEYKVTFPETGNQYRINQYARDAGGGFYTFVENEAVDLAETIEASVEALGQIDSGAVAAPQEQAVELSEPMQRRNRDNEDQLIIEFPDSGNTYTIEERTEGNTKAIYNVENGNVIGKTRAEAIEILKNVERLTALTPDRDTQNIETIVPIATISRRDIDLNNGPSIALSPIESAVREDMDILRFVMKLNVSGTPSTVIPRVSARLDSFNSKAGTKGSMLDDSMEFDFKEFGSTSKLFRILSGKGAFSDGSAPIVQPDRRSDPAVRLPTLIQQAQGPVVRRLEEQAVRADEGDSSFFDNNDLIRQYSHSFLDMLELGFPVEFTNVSGVFANPFKESSLGTFYPAKRAISINPSVIREAVNPDGNSRGNFLHVLAHEHLHFADFENSYTFNIPEFRAKLVGDEITADNLTATSIELDFGAGTQELYDAYINNTELGKEFSYPFVVIASTFNVFGARRELRPNASVDERVVMEGRMSKTMRSLEKELFAQAGTLFLTKPNQLKQEAPITYGILEKIFKQPNLTGQEIASGQSDISVRPSGDSADRFVLPDIRSLPVAGGDQIPSLRGGQPVSGRGGRVGDTSAGMGVQTTGGDGEQPGRLRPDVGDDITDQQRYLYQKSKGNVRGKFAVTKLLNETNTEQQLPQLEELVSRHPNALDKPSSWLAFERDLTGTNETLRPPYALIELFNNMDQWVETHGRLSEEQIVAAREGLNTAKELGDLYKSGDADPAITGKLMLWGMMSRMLTASAQEAGFVDLLTSMKGKNANRTEQFIDSALDGVFTDQDVADWRAFVPTAIKEGSFGRAGTSNANDFGTFLKKMSERDSDGVVKLQKLHDLIADRSIPSSEVRRQFQGMTSDPGIGNKVFSFLLLMTGRDDVVVLDRIQLNTMWDAGRYGKLIYDDIAMNFEGQHGLARYEVLENALKQKIGELYQRLGRGDEGSVGRYHWESWVLNSGQVVAHPTMRGLVADAEGKASPYAFLGAPEGRQNMYRYGAIYARDADGEQYIMYPDSKGTPYKFSPKQFSSFIEAIKKRGTGIIPKGFLVSDYNKGFPWYEADGIDRQKLDEQIEAYAEREANEVEYGVKEATEVEDVSDGSGQRLEPTLQPDQGDDMLGGMRDPDQDPTPSFNAVDETLTALDAETRLQGKIRTGRQKVVDRLEGLKRLEDIIAERIGLERLPSELSAYDAENLMHSKVQKQLEEFEVEHVEPIAELVKGSGLDIDQVGLYLLAKHAPERNRRMFEKEQELRAKQMAALQRDLENTEVQDPEGSPAIRQKIEDLEAAPFRFEDNGSGMTYAQAASVIEQAEADGKTEQLEAVSTRIYEMLDQMRDNMVAKGLLDEETRADWEDTYQFYVPLKGFASYAEGLEIKGNPKAAGFSIRGSESFKARGRVTLPVNPLLVSFKDAEEKIVRAEKNQIAQRLLTMLSKNQDKSLWSIWNNRNRPESETRTNEKMTLDEMKRERRKDDGLYKYIQVKRGGQTFFIEIKDRELNRQLQTSGVGMFNNTVDFMNVVLTGLQKFQNFRRNMLINYNPSWGLVNPLRDIQTGLAFALSEQDVAGGRIKNEELIGKISLGFVPSGFAFMRYRRGKEGATPEAKEYDKYTREYVEDGAPTGLSVSKSLEEQQKRFEAIVKQGSFKKKLKAAGKAVEDFNQTMENAVRLSTYVEARKAGVARADAATLAKDLTVNFNRKGEYSSAIDSLYLFFNAAVQGNVNIAKALLREGSEGQKITKARSLAATMVVWGFARTVFNIMNAGMDDDDEPVYKDYNEYALRTGMLFAFEGQGVAMPMPYGWGVFDNIGRYGAELAYGIKSPSETALNMASALDHHFNPMSLHASKDGAGVVDAALQKGLGLFPDVMEVGLELYGNINFFGGDIKVPQNAFLTPEPESVPTKRGTNEVISGITQFINYATAPDGTPNVEKYRSGVDINPEQVQHLYEFFMGGVGRFFDDTSDTIAKMVSEDKDLRTTDLPILRTFLPLPSEYSDRVEFYRNRDSFRQYRDQYRDANAADRAAIEAELGTKVLEFNLQDKAADKTLRELSNEKKSLENNALIDPVVRIEAIKRNAEMQEAVFDKYNRNWEKVKP